MKIPFTKMHGLGNDYIYVDVRERELPNPSALSVAWSNRHTGIGSDGLVLIGGSQVADFSMRIFNADGSEALMCGNASRCIGKYLHDKHITDLTEIRLETLSGIKIIRLNLDAAGNVDTVTVDMGEGAPMGVIGLGGQEHLLVGEKVEACGHIFNGTAISMGNPHLVLLVPNAELAPVAEVGAELEYSPMFPNRTNVEFAEIIDRQHIRMRVWERGSGITQACGTGACATAVAAALADLTDADNCTIQMDGGSLHINWNPATRHVLMTGTATTVFEGEIEID
ncbi:MAG: diaminopimelate epimerase [Salinivirgaceae bacterium]|nr:diaminopimelate epimerase [Salinivirgaceae bacterium]